MFEWLSSCGTAIGFLGAALAVGMTCSGSAKGVGMVGRAGAGVMSIDPSKFSRVLILQILPGTQGLYGLVVWFLALMKLGFFDGALVEFTLREGWAFFGACMPVAIGGFIFALAQGRLCSSSISLMAKRPGELSKGIILAIMVEFYAILALLSAFLMLNNF